MGNMLKKTPNVDDSSPTMDIASLFILINLANHYGCSMESFDVPSAYLNCDLNELIHMIIYKETSRILCKIDPSYKAYLRKNGTILVKLQKNLYGLRQAAKNWYECLKTHLIDIGYEALTTDPCVFIKFQCGKFCIAGIYVDDVFFFGTHHTLTRNLKDYVKQNLHVKKFDKDKLSYLGLEIVNDVKSGITTISQHHYLKELFTKCNIDVNEFKTKRTVLTPSTIDFFVETDTNITGIDQKQFRSTVMALMFAAKQDQTFYYMSLTLAPIVVMPRHLI